MLVATFNINNINRRLANLLAWLAERQPDVVCLQEIKCAETAFPRKAIEAAEYGAVWLGQSAYNGVAILAKGVDPVLTQIGLPGDPADLQSRYIEAAVGGVLVGCLYAPNGNPQPGPKFVYKLRWLDRLTAHATQLYGVAAPVVLAGDYNIVPTDFDIYPSRSWAKNALVQPESRAVFERFLASGWADALRTLHPRDPMYTFWDYKRQRWPRDAGMRLDHLLLNRPAADLLQAAGVDRDLRGHTDASDHAPAWIELSPIKPRRGRSRGSPSAG